MLLRLLPVLLLVLAPGPLAALAASSPLSPRLGPDRPLPPEYIGLNGNVLSLERPWDDPQLLAAFRQTHAGLFRFPAGTIANTWDWDLGWLDPLVKTEDLIDWVRQIDRGPANRRRYGLDDLARFHRGTGTTVVFVLNLLSKDLEHSLRGLRRARDLGLPVRYIEMGNELFFNLPLESRVFPTPEDYGRTCQSWLTAIKREFPGVKCGLVAGGRAGHPRSDRWTERALAHCPAADAVIVHTYTPSGLLGRVRRDVTAGTEGRTEGAPDLPPEARQQLELRLLNSPAGFAQAMTTAYAAARRNKDAHRHGDKEVWMTEWNLRADREAFRGTWANALFIACFYHAFLEDAAVTMSHYHNIVSPTFAAIYRGENELSQVRGRNLKTTPYALTAGGLATSFFGRVMTGQTSVRRLDFPGVAALDANEVSLPTLLGWRFAGPRGHSAILINLAESASVVAAGDAIPANARSRQFAATPDAYVTGPDSIPATTGQLGRQLSLPPRSVTLLDWP